MRKAYFWITLQCFLGLLCLVMVVTGCGSALGGNSGINGSSPGLSFTPLPPGPPAQARLLPTGAPQAAPGATRDELTHDLTAGWNTLSFPFDGVSATSGFNYYLYKYNGSGYEEIDPAAHPEAIDCSKSYWAYANQLAPVTVNGSWSGSTHTVTLNQGWNLFAFPVRSATAFSQVSAIYNSQSKALGLAGSYDTATGAGAWFYARAYKFSDNTWTQLQTDNGLNQFEPWCGYWIWSWVNGAVLDFTAIPQPPGLPPSLDSVYPASGLTGAVVTLTGNNFKATQGSSTVSFNGVDAGTAGSWSNTKIVIQVPGAATTGQVLVSVNGQSSNTNITYTVTSLPHLDRLNPPNGPAGTLVTLLGSNFGAVLGSVSFNGVAAANISSWDNFRIVATVPAGAGTGPAIVTAGGQASNGVNFTITVNAYYVDANNGNNANPGSQALPFKTVTKALSVCAPGDTINVAQGTYNPDAGEAFPLVLKTRLRLIGGYNAGFTDWNPALYPSILDANRTERLITISQTDNVELNGFTLTRGTTAVGGGGIYLDRDYYTSISNCVITDNITASTQFGAGIHCNRSSPRITNCTISYNVTGQYGGVGGGMYINNYSSPTLTNCSFEYNSGAVAGGGIYCTGYSSPHLVNVSFNYNTTGDGAGMYIKDYSSASLENCLFRSNTASQAGGGIYITTNSSLTFTNGALTNNTATGQSAGGICSTSSTLYLTNCLIDRNTATNSSGAALYLNSTTATLAHCTLVGNIAKTDGGGINAYNSGLTLLNSTFYNNRTTNGYGGGLFSQGSTVSINYCDFNANLPTTAHKSGTGDVDVPNFTTVGWGGTGCFNTDPQFTDYYNYDYHLLAGSPCIDTGEPGYTGYLLDGSWETQAGFADVTPLDMGYHYPR